MEFNQIKNLIEQYFEGDTSVEQEQLLRTYFSGEEIHDELTLYTPIFRFQTTDSKQTLSSEFNSNLKSAIIDDLMASFFEGESSLEDEKVLKEYFAGNIEEKHKEFVPYFTYTTQEAIPKLSADFNTDFQSKLMDSLIEDYFEGETSLEDEKMLHQYFQGEVSSQHLKYKDLFGLFVEERKPQLSTDFNQNLEEKLSGGKVIEMKPAEEKGKIRRITPTLWRAAAMIALAVGALWMLDLPKSGTDMPVASASTIDWTQYEPKNAEEALEKTKAALALVSRKMKEGEEQTLKGFRKMKSANQAIGIN